LSSMDNQLILIADGDAKNLQILKDNLEAAGFLVSTVTNGKDAWDEIQSTPPKLILTETNLPSLSGYQLLERLKSDPNTSDIPLLFLTKQRELQQRLRGFELGAKDYLVKPLHVKEVIAHIRMVLRRLERRKNDHLESYKKFTGRLDQLNLADLIESFGVERKTGILTLNNGKRTGQVYFKEGSVINASLSDFKMEGAIYQMFPWANGYFNMLFREVDVTDDISISNLGLLLQGIKRLEIRNKLIRQLPSPKTAFTITPTFKQLLEKKNVGNGSGEFVELLDGEHNVEQIIDDCNIDDLIALKRIVRLYQQGFIKPTITPVKKPSPEQKIIIPEKKVKYISKPDIVEKIKQENDQQLPPFEPDKVEENIFEIKPLKKPIESEDEFKPSEIGSLTTTVDEKEDTFEIKLNENIQQVLNSESQTTDIEKEVPPFVEEEGDDNIDEKSHNDIQHVLNSESQTTDTEKEIPPIAKENDDDNIFQIKPIGDNENLESEIKPILEQIEQEHESSVTEKEEPEKLEQTAQQEKEPEPEFTKHLEPVSLPQFEENSNDVSEQIFIDEELLRQSTIAMEHETSDAVEDAEETPPKEEEAIEIEKQMVSPTANKIMLISMDDDCKDEILDILTNDNFNSKKIPEADNFQIDFGRINFAGFTKYDLIAVSVEKNLNSFLESVKHRISGNIFCFDCTRPETWEYTNYLIHSIWHNFKIPYVIAVMNFQEQDSITMDVIRYKLNIAENITMITFNEADKSSISKLLMEVTNDI